MSATADVYTALLQRLALKGLTPRPAWLNSYIDGMRAGTPHAALLRTAEFRLLQSNITETLATEAGNTLPVSATDATIQEQTSSFAVVVQVLDIEDIGHSRWSQVERIEQQERGEMTRGREIIRVVADSEDRDPPPSDLSKGPHKLLVEDARGTKLYAFEVSPVSGISLGMAMGSKLLLRNAPIARGMLLLEPSNAELLGGLVKSWAEQWALDHKATLRARIPT